MKKRGNCKKCGKKFLVNPKAEGHKFCSHSCRTGFWFEGHKEVRNRNVRAYRARRYAEEGCWRDEGPKARKLKLWMIRIKSKPCSDCGLKFPVCCMDFDHARGTKKFNLGSMFAHHYSKKLIEKELKKCDLVCANCHRVRTRDRKIGNSRNLKTGK